MDASPRLPGPTQRDKAIAGIATLLLLIGMPIGYLSGNTTTGDVIGLIVLTLVSLALMAFLFLRVVPLARAAAAEGRPARRGLTLGVLGAVTVIVFWTGLPFPLGAGAVALGLVGQELPPPDADRGKAITAIVLGTLAVLLAFVGLLTG